MNGPLSTASTTGTAQAAGAQAAGAPTPVPLSTDDAAFFLSGLFKAVLSFTLVGCAIYAFTQEKQVTLIAAAAGGAMGLTAFLLPPPLERPGTASFAFCKVAAILALATGVGFGGYHLSRWKPVAGAIVFGLPAGFILTNFLPRACHSFWKPSTYQTV